MLPGMELQFWQLATLVSLLCLLGVLAAANHRSRRQKRRLMSAVDHMSQGLCMYDGTERLILCNKRYIEMYGFSSEVVRPGRTLLEILQYRASLAACPAQPKSTDESWSPLSTKARRPTTCSTPEMGGEST